MKTIEAASLTVIVFLITLISGSAYAGSCGGTGHTHSAQEMAEKYFSQMDANGDELVSEDEFTPKARSYQGMKSQSAHVEIHEFRQCFCEN